MIRLVALACGLICGIGICLSALFQPMLLIGFVTPVDIWNPTLGISLLSALVAAALVFAVTQRLSIPLLGGEIEQPDAVPVAKSLAGGTLFGLGWGLAGYFPMAAFVSLGLFAPGAAIFLASVLVGIVVHDVFSGGFQATLKNLRSRG